MRAAVFAALVVGSATAGADVSPSSPAIDLSRPYEMALGRGSGRDGLEVVLLTADGKLTVTKVRHEVRKDPKYGRVTFPVWRQVTVSPSPTLVDELRKEVAGLKPLGLQRTYSAGWYDGWQWVFRISQDGREKVVYCDNVCAPELERFAHDIDKWLEGALPAKINWRPLKEPGPLNKMLWDAQARIPR